MSKPNNTHAAHRFVRRCALPKVEDEPPSYTEVEHEALHGELYYLRKLTTSRSLAAVSIDGHDVFLIVKRKDRQPITVLTARQAANTYGEHEAAVFDRLNYVKRKVKQSIDKKLQAI